MKKILLWAAMLVLTVALASSASAADLTAMDERIAEMANELSEIRSSVQKGRMAGPALEAAYEQALQDAGWEVAHMEVDLSPQALGLDPEIVELAYSDIENVSPETQEKILEVREKVIYSAKGWGANPNAPLLTFNPSQKKITILPCFEELFPGWDLPKGTETVPEEIPAATAAAVAARGLEAAGRNTMTVCMFNREIAINNSGSSKTSPF